MWGNGQWRWSSLGGLSPNAARQIPPQMSPHQMWPPGYFLKTHNRKMLKSSVVVGNFKHVYVRYMFKLFRNRLFSSSWRPGLMFKLFCNIFNEGLWELFNHINQTFLQLSHQPWRPGLRGGDRLWPPSLSLPLLSRWQWKNMKIWV